MAAYICDNELFLAIATYARKHKLIDCFPLSLIHTLQQENYRSVNFRYGETTEPELIQEFTLVDKTAEQVERLCSSYDYQACECEDYKDTHAKKLIDKIWQHAQKQAKLEQEEARRKEREDRERYTELGRDWMEKNKPAWAQSVIIARLEQDQSDLHTDYHGSTTVRTIALAFSKHNRDLFPEMRKAADRHPDTQHLGTGKGRFRIYKAASQNADYRGDLRYTHYTEEGSRSIFSTYTEAEQAAKSVQEAEITEYGYSNTFPHGWEISGSEKEIEHREKHSMGGGYYLGYDRYSGWKISKTYLTDSGILEAIGRGLHTLDTPKKAKAGQVFTTETPAVETVKATIQRNEKGGIDVYPLPGERLNDVIVSQLQAIGYRWSRVNGWHLWVKFSADIWQQTNAILSPQVEAEKTEEPEQAEVEPEELPTVETELKAEVEVRSVEQRQEFIKGQRVLLSDGTIDFFEYDFGSNVKLGSGYTKPKTAIAHLPESEKRWRDYVIQWRHESRYSSQNISEQESFKKYRVLKIGEHPDPLTHESFKLEEIAALRHWNLGHHYPYYLEAILADKAAIPAKQLALI